MQYESLGGKCGNEASWDTLDEKIGEGWVSGLNRNVDGKAGREFGMRLAGICFDQTGFLMFTTYWPLASS